MKQTPIQKAIEEIEKLNYISRLAKKSVIEELKLLLPYEEEFINKKIKSERDMYKECLEQFVDESKMDEANLFLSTYGNPLAKALAENGFKPNKLKK